MSINLLDHKRQRDLGFANQGVRQYNFIADQVDKKTDFGHVTAQINYSCATELRALDADGNYQTFAANQAAITNQGLKIAPAVTNFVASSGMGGAVLGEVTQNGVGRLPTGWSQSGYDLLDVLDIGEEFGLPFIDLHVVTDNTGTGTRYPIILFPSVNITTLGTYTASCFYKKLAGNWYGPSDVGQIVVSNIDNSSYLGLGRQDEMLQTTRLVHNNLVITKDSDVSFRPLLSNLSAGHLLDLTVRIYAPQLQSGDYASDPVTTNSGISGSSANVVAYDDISHLSLANGSQFIEFNWVADEGLIFGGEITPIIGQNKACLSWVGTALKIFLNGSLATTTTLGAAEMNLNELYFGNDGAVKQTNMTVSNSTLHTLAFTDAQCIELTA